MRLFLAHRACASFVTAPTRIAPVLGQTELSYRACNKRCLVGSCLCSAPYQQLVRATIDALALGCPPLDTCNSCTCNYHTMSYYIHGAGLRLGSGLGTTRYRICAHACTCTCKYFLTSAPVNDHVIPGDVTFIVRRCARAACGDDIVIYDIGNLVLMHTCVHCCDSLVWSEAVYCVEVST